MIKPRKIDYICGAVIIFSLLGFYILKAYPAVLAKPLFAIEFSQKKFPFLYLKLSKREIKDEISFQQKTSFSLKEIKISFPFKNVQKKITREGTTFVVDKKRKIIFFQPKWGELSSNLKKIINRPQLLFGEKTLSSDFYLLSAILNTTPRDINFSSTFREITKIYTLLQMKKSLLKTSQFFSFSTGKIEGFQFGSPTKERVEIIFFDKERKKKYKLLFDGIFSQKEIDFILFSIELK